MTALGSEWTQCSNIVTSGPYTAPYRRFTSDRIIQNGDAVIIDIGAGFNGYWGDLTRVYICGNVGPTEGDARGAPEGLRRGVRLRRCHAAGRDERRRVRGGKGHALDGALGHGAGVNPWEMPFFSPASKDEPITLQEHMVFNIEPYYGEPGKGGIRLENDHIVTKDGVEIYTQYPFDERLVIDLHPMDQTTGRTRGQPPIVGIG